MDVFSAGTAILGYMSNLQNPFLVPENTTSLPTPTTSDWATLNETVGGRLYIGKPWSNPCFSTYNGEPNTQDEEACAFVQKNFFDHRTYPSWTRAHKCGMWTKVISSITVARADAFGSYSVVSNFLGLSFVIVSNLCSLWRIIAKLWIMHGHRRPMWTELVEPWRPCSFRRSETM